MILSFFLILFKCFKICVVRREEYCLLDNVIESCNMFFLYLGGISGTPMFTINDVIVAADASWSLEDWRKVIDPLLSNNVRWKRNVWKSSYGVIIRNLPYWSVVKIQVHIYQPACTDRELKCSPPLCVVRLRNQSHYFDLVQLYLVAVDLQFT